MKKQGRDIQTEAIILKTMTSGENDIFVDFLTSEGRFSGYARHGRKSQKRFGTILEPLNILRLRYRDSGGYVFLEEASLEIPLRISENMGSLLCGFYLVDLVRQFVHERSPDLQLYTLLRESLLALGQDHPLTVLKRFEKEFLEILGYHPSLESCLECGKPWEEGQKFSFVFREGGLFCRDCLPSGILSEPFSLESMGRILSRFLEYQLGRPLGSRKVLTQLGFSA